MIVDALKTYKYSIYIKVSVWSTPYLVHSPGTNIKGVYLISSRIGCEQQHLCQISTPSLAKPKEVGEIVIALI